MDDRCDSRPDCDDKSDELLCHTLSKHHHNFATYDKKLTPRADRTQLLTINISVDVNEVLKIGKNNKP